VVHINCQQYFFQKKKKIYFQQSENSHLKPSMLYTGQLNEFIRLAEIDNTNCDLLKRKITDGLTVIWALDELKLKWTEANILFHQIRFCF
jgi:hypothetical protein